MKPQDIIILVSILDHYASVDDSLKYDIRNSSHRWKIQEISDDLNLSLGVVHRSIKSSEASALISRETGRVNIRRFFDFMIHASGILFPIAVKGPTSGIATTLSNGKFPSEYAIQEGEYGYVWPASLGKAVGLEINPIHKSAIPLAMKSAYAHRILSAFDSIRMERPREKEIAADYLRGFY